MTYALYYFLAGLILAMLDASDTNKQSIKLAEEEPHDEPFNEAYKMYKFLFTLLKVFVWPVILHLAIHRIAEFCANHIAKFIVPYIYKRKIIKSNAKKRFPKKKSD